MYYRLEKHKVEMYYADHLLVYREVVDNIRLIQTKRETHLIESNNAPQRHWFCRFRRRTCCVSQSLKNLDRTLFLFSYFHAPKGLYKSKYYLIFGEGNCFYKLDH